MHRREFARTLAGAALGSAISASARSMAVPQPEAGTPFKLSVMLWTIYRDRPFEERLEKVAEAGYHAVELVDDRHCDYATLDVLSLIADNSWNAGIVLGVFQRPVQELAQIRVGVDEADHVSAS